MLELDELMLRNPDELPSFEQSVILAQSMAMRQRQRSAPDILDDRLSGFVALHFAFEYVTEGLKIPLDTLRYEKLRAFAGKHYPEGFLKDGRWFAHFGEILQDSRFSVSESVKRIIEIGYDEVYIHKLRE